MCLKKQKNLVSVMSRRWGYSTKVQLELLRPLVGFPPAGFHPLEFRSPGKQKQNQSPPTTVLRLFCPLLESKLMHVAKQTQVTKITFERAEETGSLRTAAGLWFRSFSRNKCMSFSLTFRIAIFFSEGA